MKTSSAPCQGRFATLVFSCLLVTGLLLNGQDVHGREKILLRLDCTRAGVDGRSWLHDQGFVLHKGMGRSSAIRITGKGEDGLLFQPLKPSLGFALLQGLALKDAERLEIEWRVDRYPSKGSWENGRNREPLMVTLFFGEQQDAGKFYLPDSPYFIGLFPCQSSSLVRRPLKGKSYRKLGRYICVDSVPTGVAMVSSFDISSGYINSFGSRVIPPVTGIGIEVDTSNLDDGLSLAYLRSLTLYRKDNQED